jgi:hypothetical protein
MARQRSAWRASRKAAIDGYLAKWAASKGLSDLQLGRLSKRVSIHG